MTICYLANALSIHTQRWAIHFANRGYDIHVISFRPGAIPGVQVHSVPPPVPIKQIGYLLVLPQINRLLKHIRPDILHAHYATSYGLLGALSRYRPLVITAWGSDVLIAPKRSKLSRAAVLFALQRADLVTSMAHHMTRTLVELGVPQNKIVTLPFGVDTTIFHSRLSAQEQRRIDIVCTRNFRPVYNVELVIRALSQVAVSYPGVRCVLVGDGPLRSKLEKLGCKLGVKSNIGWEGQVSPPKVAWWLSQSKVFVTPAFSDGNNVSLNEAMACGCFPIGSDIPANREWLVDGENGFLVPPDRPDVLAQRILQALESNDLRLRAAERNWQIVQERADWHKNMTGMEQYYQWLVS